MSRRIYQIAIECKSFTDKYIKYFQQIVANRTLCFVVGANKSFERLLLSLCDAMTEKYPYVATKIKEHTLQYDRMPVIHQSAIDELLNQSKLSSKAVAAIRYSSTSQPKLQYQIAYTEKGTDMRTMVFN